MTNIIRTLTTRIYFKLTTVKHIQNPDGYVIKQTIMAT